MTANGSMSGASSPSGPRVTSPRMLLTAPATRKTAMIAPVA
jgi:hypothetical protein